VQLVGLFFVSPPFSYLRLRQGAGLGVLQLRPRLEAPRLAVRVVAPGHVFVIVQDPAHPPAWHGVHCWSPT
jgi:hypothetical protein